MKNPATIRLVLIQLLELLFLTGVSSGNGSKVKDIRLPTSIRPLHYKLDLIPLLDPKENYTLYGSVSIQIQVLKPTSNITLHIRKLTIQEDSVKVRVDGTAKSDGSIPLKKQVHDETREFYILFLKKTLKVGKTYTVFMKYTGYVGDDLSGFYRSTYLDGVSNETRTLAVTKFEPTDARKAFPCFDEPALKAEFEGSIARMENMTSISNMELVCSEPFLERPGYVWDHYQKSVPMSTYLVAFVVSDFVKLESDPELSKTKFAVWVRKDAAYQAELAREIGPKVLTFFEDYFQIKFPLPKQDMIAVPDFGSGAMENWGLITYREVAILYDAEASSADNKYYVLKVIAHELAHQWFGNLVTMSWWTDLWLNEGFASYVEQLGIEAVAPEFKPLETSVINKAQSVLLLDALESSHPISIPVGHPDEISEIFDRISYDKGSTIIRMMHLFLTEKTFRQGLTNYLLKWSYNNTEQNDLWAALTEQARVDKTLPVGVTVQDIMETWTLQKGFPVIDAIRTYSASDNKVTLRQSKFQAMTEVKRENSDKYSWWVPISYASPAFNKDFSKTQPEFWLNPDQRIASFPINAKKGQWLILNVQQAGYFRVNYDQKNWLLLAEQLNSDHTKIHPVNRAQILDDALNLAKGNLLPYWVGLNLTRFMKKDEERMPLDAFFGNFEYLHSLLSKTPTSETFKKYVLSIVGPHYESVGLHPKASDSVQDRLRRVKIAYWACDMGHEKCIKEASQDFIKWMNSPDPEKYKGLPLAGRKAVLVTGIKYGGKKEWNFLWKMYTRSNLATEKELMLEALGNTPDLGLVKGYLDRTFTPNSAIRKGDAATVFRGLYKNEAASAIPFKYLQSDYNKIKDRVPPASAAMGKIIESIGSTLSTPAELEQLISLRNTQKDNLGKSARAFERAIDKAKANVIWMRDHYDTVKQWLTTNAPLEGCVK